MKMDEDYAVEAAMGMRFRLQMRQDNMATGKAEQRMPFTSPEISFFILLPLVSSCSNLGLHFLCSILLLTLASFFKHLLLLYRLSLHKLAFVLLACFNSFNKVLTFHFTIHSRYKLQSTISRRHYHGGG